MENRFIITNIHRVILTGKNEYRETVTSFKAGSCRNELIYHLSGETTVRFNGKRLETFPDCIRFLPAGKIDEYTVERKEHGECIDIFFDTDRPVFNEAVIINVRQSERIKSLFKKAFSIWVAKGDGYYFECVSLLYKIFAELQKKNYLPETQYAHIKPAVDYIEKHFSDQKITAEALCSRCTVSYPYIKKLFIKKFGVSPKKYALQLKINYACALLQSELYTVSRAAEACGYQDVNYFSRQFKTYMGCSPTDFINKYKSSK